MFNLFEFICKNLFTKSYVLQLRIVGQKFGKFHYQIATTWLLKGILPQTISMFCCNIFLRNIGAFGFCLFCLYGLMFVTKNAHQRNLHPLFERSWQQLRSSQLQLVLFLTLNKHDKECACLALVVMGKFRSKQQLFSER